MQALAIIDEFDTVSIQIKTSDAMTHSESKPYASNTPSVSIIMPAYNAAAYITESIQSVQQQTMPDWELIIVDDHSRDNTLNLAQIATNDDSRIRTFQNPQQSGPAYTRNFAIKQSRGRYLAFLDADDQWLPHKLHHQLKLMKDLNAPFCFAPYEVIRADGSSTGQVVDAKAPQTINYHQLLKKEATVGCLTVMIDRALAPDIQMPALKRGQDYACWLHVLRTYGVAVRSEHVLGLYRLTPGSVSRNKLKKVWYQWRIYRTVESIAPTTSLWLLANYCYRALFRQ